MEKITVQIDARWQKRINSPLMYLVGALTGVSITFAPYGLYMLGQQGVNLWHPLVLLCLLAAYLVPYFYIRLAGEVIGQLYRPKAGKSQLNQ